MPGALERTLGKDAQLALKTRIGGAVMLGCGMVLTKIGVLDVLDEARRHVARSVSINSGVAFIPMALLLGAAMLIGGGTVAGWGKRFGLERRADGKRSPAAWGVGIALAAPGLGLYFWLQQAVEGMGYGR